MSDTAALCVTGRKRTRKAKFHIALQHKLGEDKVAHLSWLITPKLVLHRILQCRQAQRRPSSVQPWQTCHGPTVRGKNVFCNWGTGDELSSSTSNTSLEDLMHVQTAFGVSTSKKSKPLAID